MVRAVEVYILSCKQSFMFIKNLLKGVGYANPSVYVAEGRNGR
jgi:hypothetical protein